MRPHPRCPLKSPEILAVQPLSLTSRLLTMSSRIVAFIFFISFSNLLPQQTPASSRVRVVIELRRKSCRELLDFFRKEFRAEK
jgi:hypothetical protein